MLAGTETAVTSTFESIYRDFYGVVRNYVRRHFPSLSAEDVTQEVMLRALKQVEQGRPVCQSWFITVAHNWAIDQLRSMDRRPVVPMEHHDRLLDHVLPDLPGLLLQEREAWNELQNRLDHLPKDWGMMLVLHECGGYTYNEIAALMGVPLGTVRSRLHRAKAVLSGRETRKRNPIPLAS
jgi:RNA polymerase sigma-70 factor (ECF subfamily)